MSDQLKMGSGTAGGVVECLGMTFPSDDARREHFLGLLAEKLKDPAFRKQEGFPQGTDEAILAMSDPPYYTACPNPWLADFVKHYGKAYDPADSQHIEPFVADVSEGKNDPIYNAHSYHTKVPHKAIMRYLEHYTGPGDVILDGFCGTGMTGVAASHVPGDRTAVLLDLSPIATFIARNLNGKLDSVSFIDVAKRIIRAIKNDIPWLYETNHSGWKVRDRKAVPHQTYDRPRNPKGEIEFVLFSDVVSCANCGAQHPFYSLAVDEERDAMIRDIQCPTCGVVSKEASWTLCKELVYDPILGEEHEQAKTTPVLINYSVGTSRFEKIPDKDDLSTLIRASDLVGNLGFPTVKLIPGKETQRNVSRGITHLHHFFTARELVAVSKILDAIRQISDRQVRDALIFSLTACLPYASRMRRFRADRKGGGPLSGTLYVSSLTTPPNVLNSFLRNAETVCGSLSYQMRKVRRNIVSTQSATSLSGLPDKSIDYIFVDPPFGSNFDYSELNFFWEGLLGVTTKQDQEAIVSTAQSKSINEYRDLLTKSFREFHRVLKPGRWMTVEFSNTQASVWNTIQTALQEAGFVVANVSALDKKQGSFKAVMTTTAVKQDLIITAYKPNGGLEERFENRGGTEESVWDFVTSHLRQLPIVKMKSASIEFIAERYPRILFDRMVAWFIQHNAPVPLSSQEFQEGLLQRFYDRDGMIFLSEQVGDYDRARARATQAPQIELFVSDERSAIDWLTDYLKKRPSTYQELQPEFFGQLGAGWRKHEARPELSSLLEDNFLEYSGNGDVPSQLHSYLSTNFKDLRGLEKDNPRLKAKAKDRWYVPDPSKAKDLEQKRERSLLKEFESYKSAPGRRLKEFRLEVLRAGFKTAWAGKDYKTIIGIAQKIPDDALQEDEKLLLWYDQALTRMEADA